MTRYQGTRITGTPTFSGTHGEAWRVVLPPPGQRKKADYDGTVGGFIVRAPQAHPLWDHYVVTMIHLRPIEGVKPADIRTPGATHEFMIASMDPERALPPTLDANDDAFQYSLLRPIDVIEQFAAADDVTADRILELAVRAIVDGFISPDQDNRQYWKDAIASTAAHFADGVHTTGPRH